jgi:hypothetical protein
MVALDQVIRQLKEFRASQSPPSPSTSTSLPEDLPGFAMEFVSRLRAAGADLNLDITAEETRALVQVLSLMGGWDFGVAAQHILGECHPASVLQHGDVCYALVQSNDDLHWGAQEWLLPDWRLGQQLPRVPLLAREDGVAVLQVHILRAKCFRCRLLQDCKAVFEGECGHRHRRRRHLCNDRTFVHYRSSLLCVSVPQLCASGADTEQ